MPQPYVSLAGMKGNKSSIKENIRGAVEILLVDEDKGY